MISRFPGEISWLFLAVFFLDLLPDSKKFQGSTHEIGNHICAEVLHLRLSLSGNSGI